MTERQGCLQFQCGKDVHDLYDVFWWGLVGIIKQLRKQYDEWKEYQE